MKKQGHTMKKQLLTACTFVFMCAACLTATASEPDKAATPTTRAEAQPMPSAGVRQGTLVVAGGGLQLALDERGRVTELVDLATGANCVHPRVASYLLSIVEYGKQRTVLNPTRMRVLAQDKESARVALDYESGATATVEIRSRALYLRLAVSDVQSRVGIEEVHWGPYATSMEGPIGEFLGLNRRDNFTIGLLGLNLNTDGRPVVGGWLPASVGGSRLEAISIDRSRTRKVPCDLGALEQRSVPVLAIGVPNLTVTGSAVALFGCEPKRELDVVEAIELGEGLPHPMLDGQWAKRSPRSGESAVWIDYNEKNIDRCVELTKQAGLRILCKFRAFANWGHYDPDPRSFPGGIDGLRACSEKARAAGIRSTMYTLSTFIMSKGLPEPFIAPVPDQRLQIVPPAAKLAEDATKDAAEIVLAGGDIKRLQAPFVGVKQKIMRIGNELIGYETAKPGDSRVRLEGCQRGLFGTTAEDHKQGATVTQLYFTYWEGGYCFFPGTEEMNRAVAENIAAVARKGGLSHVTLDGIGGCLSTGHDFYSLNAFMQRVYDEVGGENVTFTASRLNNYCWHITTYASWGEYDLKKGFRGTMLDYRLWQQVRLRRNHMPSKMGQYYPLKQTTVEDIEWVMALGAGYDAGVEFHFMRGEIFDNPNKDRILNTIRNWEEARLAGAFTEEQKLQLRQTDCLFRLDRKPGGGWEPRFVRRWRDSRLQIEAPSSAPVKSLSDKIGTVASCSIDFDWTHDPGIYRQSCLTDDLIHSSGAKASEFEVKPPWALDSKNLIDSGHALLFVLRTPSDAPCAIRNPRLVVNGDLDKQICVPVTLEPGQYIATPHEIPVVCVYNANHQIIKEVPIRDLPRLSGGGTFRVSVSCEPVDPKAKATVRLNLRFNNPI